MSLDDQTAKRIFDSQKKENCFLLWWSIWYNTNFSKVLNIAWHWIRRCSTFRCFGNTDVVCDGQNSFCKVIMSTFEVKVIMWFLSLKKWVPGETGNIFFCPQDSQLQNLFWRCVFGLCHLFYFVSLSRV